MRSNVIMAENRFNSRPLVNSWEALPTDDARSESQSTNTFTTASTRSMRNMGDRPLPKPPFEIIVISQAVGTTIGTCFLSRLNESFSGGGLKVDKSVLSCTVTIGSPWRFTFYCNKDQVMVFILCLYFLFLPPSERYLLFPPQHRYPLSQLGGAFFFFFPFFYPFFFLLH